MRSLAKENYLSELKKIDWDFAGENGKPGFAGFHWYPARFVPQVPGILINFLSAPGEIVLDPFCGSGTTLTEAYKFGRHAVGIDLNPIACLMARAKLIEINENECAHYFSKVVKKAKTLLIELKEGSAKKSRLMETIPNLKENRQWYHVNTLEELSALWFALQSDTECKYYIVGMSTFSSILRTCCSQDKHWGWICDNVKPRQLKYKNAMDQFKNKIDKYKRIALGLKNEAYELQEDKLPISEVEVLQGNATVILSEITNETFDLVVTSPPYCNTTDYIKSQRLSFLWFEGNIEELRKVEIGARFKRHRKNALEQYLREIRCCFKQIVRVLKSGRFCCVILGESPKRKPFLEEFERICEDLGLELEERLTRNIASQRSFFTIQNEYIYILRKK